MNKDYLSEIYKLIDEKQIFSNEAMKNYTSFKVGGPCDLLIKVKKNEDVSNTIRIAKAFNEPIHILGNCTNTIVRDKGIRGTVIIIGKDFSSVELVEDNIIRAQSGALLSKTANFALENSLSGFEFAAGIPGSIGGGVSMNAGAYGGQLEDIVLSSEYLDKECNIVSLNKEQHEFKYRHTAFTNTCSILLNTTFILKKGNKEDIKNKMVELSQKRSEKQPLKYPSAGSVFKRPEGYYTGKLIQDCNLKGASINGASVSELHAGFIINKDNATAQDILDLIEHIQKTVYNKFKVRLEKEVKVIGEV